MNDTQLTAIIVGITGIMRARLPKIDGIVVPAVAIAIGATLGAMSNPARWREALVHGIGVALAAVGGMTAIGYAGQKVGEAVGEANSDRSDVITTPAVTSASPASPEPPTTTNDAGGPAAHV